MLFLWARVIWPEEEWLELVSSKFCEMASLGLMKDTFHYKQTAYNIVGTEAGTNTAYYVLNVRKPEVS